MSSTFRCSHCGAVMEMLTSIKMVEPPPANTLYKRSARGRFGLRECEGGAVDFAVDGLSNKEIADKMKTTEQVIKNYLCSAFAKIGCTNRAEMVHMVLLGTDKPR